MLSSSCPAIDAGLLPFLPNPILNPFFLGSGVTASRTDARVLAVVLAVVLLLGVGLGERKSGERGVLGVDASALIEGVSEAKDEDAPGWR